MLNFIGSFIVGIVVGAIARFIMPGHEHLGLIMTGVLGIVGAFVGGFIARLFNEPVPGQRFHPAGLFMSVIGALVVLYAWHHVVLR